MRGRQAQQEMVGFILIVILVVVALMVFLIISASKPLVSVDSQSTKSLMSSVLSYTTDCVVSEPYKMNVMEVMISCYEGKKCVNMNKMACVYLNETLTNIMKSLVETDPTIVAYRLEGYWQTGEQRPDAFYTLSSGICASGKGSKLQGEVQPLDAELRVLLELCTESNS